MSKSKTDEIQTIGIPSEVIDPNCRKSIVVSMGIEVISIVRSLKGMFCFLLIVLGVVWKKRYQSSKVVKPLFWQEISKSGLVPLPMILFLK